MANLFGQNIGTNYKGILNLNTLNGNLSGTLESVTDGDGNASALQISTGLSRFSGNLTIGGSTTAAARLHVRGDGTNPIARFENNAGTNQLSILNDGTLQTKNIWVGGSVVGGSNQQILGENHFTFNNYRQLGGFPAYVFNSFGNVFTSGTNPFVTITGDSIAVVGSGSPIYRPLNIAYTINNTGAANTGTATGIFLNATETALNGMGHNLMDLQVGGVSRFKILNNGVISMYATEILFGSGSRIMSDGNGTFRLSNFDKNNFTNLIFGGTTNAFPALKRSSAELQVRLADDSGFASLQVGDFRNNGNFNIYRTDGYYVLNYGNVGNVLDFNPGNGSSLTIRMRGQTIGNLFYIKANEDRIGIGTDTPNASAILDISTTTKGFLPPRGTNAQMLAIATPATGLVFYDTTNNKLNVYDGTNWVAMH